MTQEKPGPCPICEETEWVVRYQGPVRQGEFGKTRDAVVYRCTGCGIEHLPPLPESVDEFYRSGAYREKLGQDPSAEGYMELHDQTQFERTQFLQGVEFRDRTVVDVGCAGGSFLDLVKGYAARTIGVDPATYYEDAVEARGHEFFGALEEAVSAWEGHADVVTAFDVIEHVEDPVTFLRNIRRLLSDSGNAIIATPNAEDILVQEECEAYLSFFYRDVHLFYFDERSLCLAAQAAGFENTSIRYFQEYNFGNFVHWMQQGEPTGNDRHTALGEGFDEAWRAELRRQGTANTLVGLLE